MGMLNNPHYRIKTKPESSQHLGLGIHCEHPTKSGGEAGGWMEREVLANAPPAAEVVVSTGPDTSKLPTYSPEEVSLRSQAGLVVRSAVQCILLRCSA